MSFRHTLYTGATFRALYILLVFCSTIALIKGYDLFFKSFLFIMFSSLSENEKIKIGQIVAWVLGACS